MVLGLSFNQMANQLPSAWRRYIVEITTLEMDLEDSRTPSTGPYPILLMSTVYFVQGTNKIAK